MSLDIAIVLGTRHLADDGGVRLIGAIQMQEQRQQHAREDAKLHAQPSVTRMVAAIAVKSDLE